MNPTPGLQTLLEMHDSVIDQGCGYWILIRDWRVEETDDVPHGIRYSLTLHNPRGTRILGYDNAHSVRPPEKFRFAGLRLPYDHKHRSSKDKGVPYEFRDAYQLPSDFFQEADSVLEKEKGRR